ITQFNHCDQSFKALHPLPTSDQEIFRNGLAFGGAGCRKETGELTASIWQMGAREGTYQQCVGLVIYCVRSAPDQITEARTFVIHEFTPSFTGRIRIEGEIDVQVT